MWYKFRGYKIVVCPTIAQSVTFPMSAQVVEVNVANRKSNE